MTLSEIRSRVYDELAEDESSPSRYSASDVLEYLNDGVAYYTARVGHDIDTSTLTQTANQLWYDLPTDCLQIRRVTRDASTGSYSKVLQPLNARLMDYQYGLEKRWGQDTDTRARGYMPFGTDEVALYPNISSSTDAFTLTYRKDSGYSNLSADTDEPSIPDEDHDALPLYAVARCLLVDGKVQDGLRHWTAWRNRVRGAKARRSSAERLWQDDVRGSL